MAKLTFEDMTGSTPAMLWPEEYAKMTDLVKNDLIGFIKGVIDRRRDPPELVVSRIIPLEAGPAELTRGVVVRLHKGVHQSEHLERLLRTIRIRPGNLDLYLEIVGIEQVRRAIYKAGASLRVRYDNRLIPELERVVGAGHVRLLGQRGATARIDAASQGTASSVSSTQTTLTASSGTDAGLDDAPTDDDEDL
jgi:DNA polymerase-3 subunit alpha